MVCESSLFPPASAREEREGSRKVPDVMLEKRGLCRHGHLAEMSCLRPSQTSIEAHHLEEAEPLKKAAAEALALRQYHAA